MFRGIAKVGSCTQLARTTSSIGRQVYLSQLSSLHDTTIISPLARRQNYSFIFSKSSPIHRCHIDRSMIPQPITQVTYNSRSFSSTPGETAEMAENEDKSK